MMRSGRLRILATALVLVGCAGPQQSTQKSAAVTPFPARTSGIDSALRAELLVLGKADQAAREGFGVAAAAGDTVYLKRLMSDDSTRTLRLKEIVRKHGWPTASIAGSDGAEAAWLILQHSDNLDWQESLLPVLDMHARAGELSPSAVAMLTDRVLVRSARAQRYGSSFAVVDGRLVAHPIQDLKGLDARRAAVGLPPMAEYVRKLAEVYKLPVEWPPRQ